MIRQIQQRHRRAREQSQSAESARQAARELAENMTDEQRRQWAEQWQRTTGDDDYTTGTEPGQSPDQPDQPMAEVESIEDFDLAGDDLAQQVIAQWLSEETTGSADRRDRTSTADRFFRAQRAAERAVEDASVPSRYHRFIKRYFDRLAQTAEKAAAKPLPPEEAQGQSRPEGDRD